jgi:hypothetical protein
MHPEKYFADEAQQQLKTTVSSSRQGGRHTASKPPMSDSNDICSLVSDGGPAPRRTGRLTVGRKMTWTWNFS